MRGNPEDWDPLQAGPVLLRSPQKDKETSEQSSSASLLQRTEKPSLRKLAPGWSEPREDTASLSVTDSWLLSGQPLRTLNYLTGRCAP